jgi:hypothetical protein
MIYVASPYTHRDRQRMEVRYHAACDFTARLLNDKMWCYSPIVHCHELAKQFDLPRDFEFWKEYNIAMLNVCNKLFILGIDGWKESTGVTAELECARSLKIPVTLWGHNGVGYFGEPL